VDSEVKPEQLASVLLSAFEGSLLRAPAAKVPTATIAASTIISCFVSLTLSPALCAVLFEAHWTSQVSMDSRTTFSSCLEFFGTHSA
jgi:hypothetical protein